jgi:hypothetical protein
MQPLSAELPLAADQTGGVKEIIDQAKDHDASLLFIWPMNPLICSAERFATITL